VEHSPGAADEHSSLDATFSPCKLAPSRRNVDSSLSGVQSQPENDGSQHEPFATKEFSEWCTSVTSRGGGAGAGGSGAGEGVRVVGRGSGASRHVCTRALPLSGGSPVTDDSPAEATCEVKTAS